VRKKLAKYHNYPLFPGIFFGNDFSGKWVCGIIYGASDSFLVSFSNKSNALAPKS